MNIEELSQQNIIKFTQSYQFEVILAEGENSIELKNVFVIEKKPEMTNLINERLHFKIDGEDIVNQSTPLIEEDEFEKKVTLLVNISGKKRFLVESKERREYCITDDNYKLLRVSAITKEMDVSIHYPENMVVSFFNVGLVNRFERKHIEHDRTISRIHKKGLILPYQGFGITFGIK